MQSKARKSAGILEAPPALPCRAEKRRTAACGAAVLAGYEVICYQPLIFTMVAMRSSTLLE